MSSKISQLTSGGAVQPGDEIPVARSVSGTPTNFSVNVGTAAAKAASNASDANLASVSGTPAAGHVAVFADTAGTIADGGPAPASFDSSQILGTYGFYDFLDGTAVAADAGPQLQAFLLACQLKAYALGNNSLALDDQMQRNFLVSELPRGNYQTSIPLIVPENVALRWQGTVIRLGQNGTATNTYTGDVNSQALANLVQPTVVVPTNAHILDNLDVYGNSNGSDKGSGVAIGKNWVAASVTPAIAGTGYTVGDIIYFPQVSKGPYFPISVVVTAINGGGGITATTLPTAGGSSSVGCYALPPVLQQTQWTAANGFAGAVANGSVGKVFDPAHAGYYVTRGGTGTGAEFTVSWAPDFAGAGAHYSMGLPLVGDTIIENITATSLGSSLDSTYGAMFGTIWGGLNYDIVGQVETTGGYYGTFFAGAADVHGGTFTAVNAANTAIKFAQASSASIKAIIDSPFSVGLAIDGSEQINILDGSYCIQFNQPGITGVAMLAIGNDSAYSNVSSQCSALDVNLTIQNGGSTGTTPAAYVDYIADGSRINLNVSNTNSQVQAVAYPNKLFAAFGTHLSPALSIGGSIDGVPGSIFSGTVPNCGIHIVDGAAGGIAGPCGIYTLYGSGAPTSGGSGTGLNKAIIGSTYTDRTTGLKYNQTGAASSPVWSAANNPNLTYGEIGKGFDNGSSVIATGQAAGYTVCPFAGTITGWQLIGNASGSVVVDVWKVASGSIPTVANTITASAKPTLASAQQASSTALTGWTTSVAKGDVFAFSVNSATTLTHADLAIFITKS